MTALHRGLRGMRLVGVSLLLGTGSAMAAADLAEECRHSSFMRAIPAEKIERQATEQYAQVIERAQAAKALAPATHPQVVRLRQILARLLAAAEGCNERAREWTWEIHLIGSASRDTWSMPGGKLVVFYGLLNELQLDDDELAAALAHLVAQSLLEQSRERAGHAVAARAATGRGMEALNWPNAASDPIASVAADFLSLQFREQQTLRADRIGLMIAARAGHDPAAALRLLRKLNPVAMAPASAPSERTLSNRRMSAMQELLAPATMLYEQAPKPVERFAPPPKPKD